MRKKRINAPNRYLRIQFQCGIIISAIAVTVLAGWAFNQSILTGAAAGYIGMNPVTACLFLAFACWLLLKPKAGPRLLAFTSASVIAVSAPVLFLKISQLFSGMVISTDALLFASVVGSNKIAPGVVCNFLLFNLAFLVSFSKSRVKEYLYQALVLVSLAVSITYFCAYLFNFSTLTGTSVVMPMALNTCICFIVLGIGLLFTYPDRAYMRPILSKKLGGSLSRKILPLMVLLPLVTGALRIWGQRLNFYNTEVGVAIHVSVIVVLSFILAYYFAKKLNEIDAARKKYEGELLEKSTDLLKSELLLERTANLTKVGGWEVSLPEKQLTYTRELYKIRELSVENEPNFDGWVNAFAPGFAEKFLEHFEQAVQNAKPYALEAKLFTEKKQEIWVKIIGQAVLNEQGETVAIRGTLQNIDEAKKKEILLEQSMEIIHEQNTRLMNFTHIVSHNLRTHAVNIKSILSLYDNEESEEEKVLTLKMANKAADLLNQTITDLNDIVAVQSASTALKSPLYFEDVFNTAKNVLAKEIAASQAIITADFSACEKLEYVPAYLESIFHNFLSNALKYRRPDVRPEIKVKSSLEGGRVALTFSDNGLGIDLAKYKEKLFGMYKTFHYHPDSTGVGLYLTKNQVESLGGNIMVDSEVNIGTTFKILF